MNLKKIKSIKNHDLYVDSNSLEFIIVKEYENDALEIIKKLIKLSSDTNISKIIKYEQKLTKIVTYEQFIEGVTVEDMIENSQFISYQQLVDYCMQLVTIISRLHNCDILHKDIKPQNIIIAQQTVYLIDFNISRIYNQNKDKDTKLIGTEGYASPEQYGFSQTTPASDIFSLGKTFEQLLAITVIDAQAYPQFTHLIEMMTYLDPKQRIELSAINSYLQQLIEPAPKPEQTANQTESESKSETTSFDWRQTNYLSPIIDTTYGLIWSIVTTIFMYMYLVGFNYDPIKANFNHYPLLLLVTTYYLTSIGFKYYLANFSYMYLRPVKNNHKVFKFIGVCFLDLVVFAAISQIVFTILKQIFY